MNLTVATSRRACAARLRVPGDKSITHRALLLGGAGRGHHRASAATWTAATAAPRSAACARWALTVERRRSRTSWWCTGAGLHGWREPDGRAGLRPLRHHHAPAGRAAGRAAVPQRAGGRRPAAAPPDGPRRRAAAAMGARIWGRAGGPLAAPAPSRAAPLHGIDVPPARGQRPGQVLPPAGRAVCRGRDHRRRARPLARPHRAHAARARRARAQRRG